MLESIPGILANFISNPVESIKSGLQELLPGGGGFAAGVEKAATSILETEEQKEDRRMKKELDAELAREERDDKRQLDRLLKQAELARGIQRAESTLPMYVGGANIKPRRVGGAKVKKGPAEKAAKRAMLIKERESSSTALSDMKRAKYASIAKREKKEKRGKKASKKSKKKKASFVPAIGR